MDFRSIKDFYERNIFIGFKQWRFLGHKDEF